LDRVGKAPLWSLTPAEERDALVGLGQVITRLQALQLQVWIQAERDGAGTDAGATSTAAWYAHRTRTTRTTARCLQRFGQAVDEEFTATGEALQKGAVNLDQARVIVDSVRRLTTEHDDLPADARAVAEAHVLDLAAQFDADALRALGKHLFDVVCPEAAEAAEAKRLEAEEEQSRRRAWFTIRDRGDGTHEGRFVLPDLQAHILKAALETLLAPRNNSKRAARADAGDDAQATGSESRAQAADRRDDEAAGSDDPTTTADGSCADAASTAGAGRPPIPFRDPDTGDRMPYQAMLGHAFMEFLERLDPTTLPSHAGGPFTIVVTLDYDTLIAQLGTATLHTGDPHGRDPDLNGPPGMRITAGQARRLACTAGIIPMVLDGDSMPLDVGREKRLFTRYQRIALAHTYHGCAAHGCDRPPGWAEIHHTDPWREHGNTNLADGLPLCSTHHHMADHPGTWRMTTLPTKKVSFSRR
jgi:hypothetical protein